MKINIAKIIAVTAILSIFFSVSLCSVSAAESFKVNGESVSKGDIITYEYYIGGIKDPLAGVVGVVKYDDKYLEYVDDSIGFDAFNNAIFAVNDGAISYSAMNSISGFDLSDEKLAVSVSFKVINTASKSINITHSFNEIFTIKALLDNSPDLTSDQYDDRTALKVNKYDGVNSSPYLGTDADEVQSYAETNSLTVDDILEGNANSAVSSASSGGNSSKSSSSKSSSVGSGTDSSKNDSNSNSSNSNNNSADNVSNNSNNNSSRNDSNGSNASTYSVSVNNSSTVSSTESILDAAETSDGVYAETADAVGGESLSEPTQEGQTKGINVVVICIVAAFACVGAAVYIKKKN